MRVRSILLFLTITATAAATDFTDWSHYLEVTIQHEYMYSDETAKPIVLDLDQLTGGHSLWSTAQADGDDLRVSESDGETELDVELIGYDAATEQGLLWINPNTDDDADVVLRIYYGNATVGAYASPGNVWTGWQYVYHMEESTGTLNDSSPNGWDLTASGGLPNDTTGKVGQAQNFDGSGDYANNTSATMDLNNYTLLLWHYRPTGAGGYDTMVSGQSSFRYQLTSDSDQVGWGQRQTGESNQTIYPDTDWSLDTWQHRTMTRSADSVEWFLDGVADGTDSLTIEQSFTGLRIGQNIAYGGGDDYQGYLDEVMCYNGILSDGAIRNLYTSMGDPASFAEYGAHTANSAGGSGAGQIILFY